MIQARLNRLEARSRRTEAWVVLGAVLSLLKILLPIIGVKI